MGEQGITNVSGMDVRLGSGIKQTNTFEPQHDRDFQQCGMCDQQSLRSACAYAQSDHSLC